MGSRQGISLLGGPRVGLSSVVRGISMAVLCAKLGVALLAKALNLQLMLRELSHQC